MIKTTTRVSTVNDETMIGLEARFNYYLMHTLQQEPDRREVAEEMIAYSESLQDSEDIDTTVAREYLCKMACILQPKNETYWRRWAKELSLYTANKQKDLIDEVDDMTSILRAGQKKVEFQSKFYVEFIGKNDVMEMALLISKNENKSDELVEKAYQNNRVILAPRGAKKKEGDIFDVAYDLVEKAPEMEPNMREAYGLALKKRLDKKYPQAAKASIATLYLTAAYLAENNKDCFASAAHYIKHNLRQRDEVKETLDTLKAIKNASSEESVFCNASQDLEAFLQLKYEKGYRYRPTVYSFN